jgi:hypothetical protein
MATLPAVVNFTRFQLEPHVQKALRLAWVLSGGRPVNAGHLLKAALVTVRTDRSAAFLKIASLLPLPVSPQVRSNVAPADLAGMLVTRPLAQSFSLAEGFLEDKKTVWGRDYVTLALLAKDDPSLGELAREAGSDIETIRREWFDFVRSTDQRRAPDSWERWWRGAGLPLPHEAKPSPAATAYLFTWNPTRFPFPELKDHVEKVKAGGSTILRWSTGDRQSLSRGERVFLLRQAEPRGVVGVGEVDGAVVEGPHWDPTERSAGRKSLLVDVRWVALSPEPFLDLPTLIQVTGNPTIWSTQTGGVPLDPTLAQRLEEAWPPAWARHLHGLGPEPPPPIEARHWIARFDADTGGSTDRLNVDGYVNAFARVMASRTLTPPLSIGLFGDWGSGKTFFMDRLHDKIEELTKQEDTQPPLYWPRICQIRFNAWHYTETNLWASLVSTIFGRLCGFLDGPRDDADEFNRLLNQLELAGELRKAAAEKAKEAREQLEAAQKKVKDAKDKLAALPPPPPPSDKQLRAILGTSVAEVVGADCGKLVTLLESATQWSGRPEFKDAADRLKAGEETVADARALLDEARALSSRAGFWWRVLSGAKLHRTAGFWITMAALIAIPVVLALAQRLGLPEGWAHIWTLIGETLTVLGATVTWVRSRLAGASAVFDQLGVWQANVARRIEEARTEDRRVFEAARDKALTEEKKARAQLEQSEREEAQAAEAQRRAEEAVRESTSQARLGRFIRERTSSADYDKHLGLIAMIHRDFQRLSDLMDKVRDGTSDPALPRIDRVILYIDDLDRCYPPAKVVRVLEAVHLLLFFPLFVVVVGVDSRWVSRALSRHYHGMLADEATAPGEQQDELLRAPAYSQDFLEKIFQVPFWLRRMEPAAIQRLIHTLISPDEVAAAAAVAVPPSEDAAAAVPAAPGTTGSTPEDPARAAARRATAEAESEHEAVREPLAAPSESLKITEAELEFMDEVAPLMPRTPRSVKRFVNIYRLYKAALSPLALARFLGTPGRPGNFRAVQVLLALVTGTPRFAQRVFRELQVNQGESVRKLSDLVTVFGDEGDETWRTTLEALREFAKGDNDLELVALREVSPLVTRFSVHHMVSAAPGEAGLG